MDLIEGTVLRVVFRAPDGAFAVVRLAVEGRDEPVAAVGALGETREGEQLKLEGAWERHPVHGAQFRAARAVVEMPRSADGVQRWLEGLSGIGPELARRLVTAFGVGAVEVIEKEPWRAAQVRGVGKARAQRISVEAAARRQEREVMIFLQGLGVSPAYAARIRKIYGEEAVRKVRDNPYRLARDVPGIGFVVADRIARGMGIAADSPLRIAAGLLHALEGFAEEGNVCVPAPELCARAAPMLGVDETRADQALAQLVLEGAAIREDEMIYAPRLYRAEVETAERMRALADGIRGKPPALVDDGRLSEGQKRAIAAAGEAGVCVITGGPGTGKTTVVRALVASWERARRRVLLCAPTGRAAKRLSEATGRPAQTIHRLLEWGRSSTDGGGFGRSTQNPLECELLVVDEASMLDILLARSLTRAIPPGATLVLVGDVDQLPSVGPGQVLGDVIASGVARVVRLREVFRQAEGSGIVENAYRILGGELPLSSPSQPGAERGDFFVVAAPEPERARDVVVKLVKERIPRAFGLHATRDVQVLAPMHRGAAGTEGLNAALQAALNPAGAPVPSRNLRVGDKVMQVRNDYDRDVYNGDLGAVAHLDQEGGAIEVEFEGRRVRYDGDALDALEPAYAVSVHKSQGSEYPAVVVPILMQHSLLLRRNLLYTAVTRGKKLVVLVGDERAIKLAISRADTERRWTGLQARLSSVIE